MTKRNNSTSLENTGKWHPLTAIVGMGTTHPGKTIGIMLAVTIVFMIPASNLTIDTSMEGNFGDDMPEEIQRFQDIAETFGEQELVTVVVNCSHSNGTVAQAFITDLASRLLDTEWFTDIQYTSNLNFAGEKTILFIPFEHLMFLLQPDTTAAAANHTYHQLLDALSSPQYFVSDSGEIYLLNMFVNVTIDSAEIRTAIFDDLNDLLGKAQAADSSYQDLEVGYTGGMMVMDYEGDQMVFNDMFLTLIVTLILILALLFVSFRSLSLPLIALVPLLCGIIITAGLISLLFGTLSMATAVFAVLLMGLGIDFSIHLLNRFTEELKHTDDPHQAFRRTAQRTGTAIVLGTLTTATAFGALYFSQTEALHQMGVILALGLMITMLCVFFILPALVTLRLKRGSLKEKLKHRARFSILGAIGRQTVRFAGVLVILLVGFSVVFMLLAPAAEINSDIHELQPTTVPAYKWMEVVKANFNYTEDYILCVAHSYGELLSYVAALGDLPQVMSVESVLDYLPSNQSEKLALFAQVQQVHPSFTMFSWLNVTAMSWQDLPEYIKGDWVANEDSGFQFLIRIKTWGNIWDSDYREALLRDVQSITPDVASRAIMIPKIIDVMTNDVIRVSVFAALPILVIVYLGFRLRNPVYALMAVVPVLFAIGGLLALSGILGISLNMISIMMIPLVIGIGVDDSIHILHRYKMDGAGSLPQVIQYTGKAIFLTTATTTLAFSSFLVAEHPGLRSMGQVPVLGLLLCFLAAVVFLPALVAVILERRDH